MRLSSLLVSFLVISALFVTHPAKAQTDVSWESIKSEGKGTLTVYWFESRPFIYKNEDGEIGGIEYELIKEFADFVRKQYQIDLSVNWVEAQSFDNVLDRVHEAKSSYFGASAFSITPMRLQQVDFSPAYMSDIMVMVSNKNIPITESAEEFYRTFSRLRALTIKGTTYEHDLLQLKEKLEMPFEISYISSAKNILEAIGEQENTFGFIDLPMYMMYFSQNPQIKVRRQNFNPVKRNGYGFLIPKGSDWHEPVAAYFDQPNFQLDFEKVIAKHLDISLYRFVESLAMQSNKDISILTKEKEIQDQNLIDKSKELEAKTRTNYVLTALMIVSIFFMAVIVIQYRKSRKQMEKIEAQQKNIALKNQQLEQRNQHLVMLDEEKNNLIKILAHDMRAPLNQMQALSQILVDESSNLDQEQHTTINHIKDASVRLAKMISNILDVDAIEGSRINFIPENAQVMPLVQQVIDTFKIPAAQKNISLTLTGDENLQIQIDTLYMTQVLENLVSNALKFSDEGTKVEVVVSSENDKVRITVKDQGPGISEQDQANLYKKFQRLTARPTRNEGSIGLGLAIVKQYVELMGGRVWCESELGMGAAFSVEFARVSIES